MIDVEYLCNKLSDMAGLPVRYYLNKQLKAFFCFAPFEIDPIKNVEKEILKLTKNMDYFITIDSDVYGIINSNDLTIVIGPSLPATITEQQLRKRAFDLNIPIIKQQQFIQNLKMLVKMPLNSILQILCTFNYIFNNEKKNLNDFIIEQQLPEVDQPAIQADTYKAYQIEKLLCQIVANGDIEQLHSWVTNSPTVKGGTVASEPLRQSKNTFIISTTVFARVAIEVGVDIEEAFRLSDFYIQKCERASEVSEILSLQFNMIQDYTLMVNKLKKMTSSSKISKDVYHFIIQNISKPITTQMIAEHLHFSRSYLSILFKNETGVNLIDYIHHIKMEHAKILLNDPNKDITLIADYLGYSSSSHFSRTFKKIVGISAKTFRKKYC